MVKTVMLLLPNLFPVPDVKGGGVELLITQLINENEINGKIKLVIISKYDKQASNTHFNNSCIYYFENNKIINLPFNNINRRWKNYCIKKKIIRKLFHNRFTSQIFKKKHSTLDFFLFQCLLIAKKEHVDKLIVENYSINDRFRPLVKHFGKNNCYNHIHYHRKDSGCEREIIPNSLSISKFVRDEWIKGSRVSGRNEVLYNCIDTKKYGRIISDDIKKEKRFQLGFNENDIIVIFCGRLLPVKGVKELLEAFEIINENRIKLMLIGSFYYSLNKDDEFSRNIVERAKKMDNVTYLGYIPNSELQDYYSISDIQVVPSTWQEGAGLVALEGMASGLPLIITDSGGMVEYVNDDCAIKLPIDDNLPQNLSENIINLANDKQLRKMMSEAGKNRAAIFDKEMYYNNFVDIINQ